MMLKKQDARVDPPLASTQASFNLQFTIITAYLYEAFGKSDCSNATGDMSIG
ncbi:hypothetical protein [Youngiibacter multivorans]|uniref:Uncharacterized protein n=1 Tax=Youngiibacter multivorans TaxID=937251 RepID=A0ABS4G6F3_9CLOT|nr:hypothetical protein [Youngiibacter multivorans]MBP1920133.1 hypothetical protein [Youngiibacter multivorans]